LSDISARFDSPIENSLNGPKVTLQTAPDRVAILFNRGDVVGLIEQLEAALSEWRVYDKKRLEHKYETIL